MKTKSIPSSAGFSSALSFSFLFCFCFSIQILIYPKRNRFRYLMTLSEIKQNLKKWRQNQYLLWRVILHQGLIRVEELIRGSSSELYLSWKAIKSKFPSISKKLKELVKETESFSFQTPKISLSLNQGRLYLRELELRDLKSESDSFLCLDSPTGVSSTTRAAASSSLPAMADNLRISAFFGYWVRWLGWEARENKLT